MTEGKQAKKQKVLIIKVGYSETLDADVSEVTSFGDVLRTTVLLHPFKNCHVTWLVDEKAYPILRGNPKIDRLLVYNLTSVLQLQSEYFDTVVNLEKVPGLCALSDQITAWRRYGFRFDVKKGEAEAYDGTHSALEICRNRSIKRKEQRCWQEHLFEMVGAKWGGEEYVFGYRPKGKETIDIGFNYKVGNKWPGKAWPERYWKALEERLSSHYSVSWQAGLNNMEDYFEWVNSCRLIISNDSFGLHLGLAMGKKVIGLFGPTSPHEVHFYGRGLPLVSASNHCGEMPCYQSLCSHCEGPCIETLRPEAVLEAVHNLLRRRTEILETRLEFPSDMYEAGEARQEAGMGRGVVRTVEPSGEEQLLNPLAKGRPEGILRTDALSFPK